MRTKVTTLLTTTLALLYGLYNIYHIYYWRCIGGIEVYCFPPGQSQATQVIPKPNIVNYNPASLPPDFQAVLSELMLHNAVSDAVYKGSVEQMRFDPGISTNLSFLYNMRFVTVPQNCLQLPNHLAYASVHAPAGTANHIWVPTNYTPSFFEGWKGVALYLCNAAPIALTALYAANRANVQLRHICITTAAVFAINNIAEFLRPTASARLYP